MRPLTPGVEHPTAKVSLLNVVQELIDAEVELATYRESYDTTPSGFTPREDAILAAEKKLEELMVAIFGDENHG